MGVHHDTGCGSFDKTSLVTFGKTPFVPPAEGCRGAGQEGMPQVVELCFGKSCLKMPTGNLTCWSFF